MKYKKTTLPNGLRVITATMKDAPAVTVMVAVETGSNYETKAQNGLSHFLEHMMFKGTESRPSPSLIATEFDAMGATNNAFTGNELTGYWGKVETKQWRKLLDLVSDLYLHPTLPATDLEIERGVILQEISMYEDLPQAQVEEKLMELVYGDTPTGRTIAGPRENIKRFSRKDFTAYRDTHYVAKKTIVVVAGNISEREVLAEVKKLFKAIPTGPVAKKVPTKIASAGPKVLVHEKKTDQAHMVLAFPAYAANDKRVPASALLAAVLGRGMSSRLFHRLREEMGACYYVRATSGASTDYGLFTIATGVEPKRVEEVTKALVEECKKLIVTPVSKKELDKAKEYVVGHLYLGLETSDALAGFYLEQEVERHAMHNPSEVEKIVRKLTASDVQNVARDLFKKTQSYLAVVGPVKADQARLKKALML